MNTSSLHHHAQAVTKDSSLETFRRDLRRGLRASPRTIPCKYFYDARGSELFEEICAQPEYYPTRAELRILAQRADEIGVHAGLACALIELGSGSSRKTRLILDRLSGPVAYVPVEISASALDTARPALERRYPTLPVLPVCADYTQSDWSLPELARAAPRRLFFFPGSTIGNFTPGEARTFLQRLGRRGARGDGVLVGVDLAKDPRVLEAAYNDAAGVTAEFNLNLLRRANRELGTDFNVKQFMHAAVYNETACRVEMRLVSCRAQTVHLDDEPIRLESGAVITTEYSYKYSLDGFARLAREAGLTPVAAWTDPDELFGVHYLTT